MSKGTISGKTVVAATQHNEHETWMSKPKPNELCWCGSTAKYKKCHKAFDEAPSDQKYVEAQRLYARSWNTTSGLQHARGDYAWMAEQLAPFTIGRLFDVGCGSGHGLLALVERYGQDLRIVSVDENLSCLRVAKEVLQQSGVEAHVVARLECRQTPMGFAQEARPITEPFPKPIALIEADPMTDPHLEAALRSDGLFDAVTIWLTGAHMMRSQNSIVRSRGISNERGLRIHLQNAVYELADRILRPDGILQVIDRMEAPSTDLMRDVLIQSHREQAEPTTLDVREVAHRPWSPPQGGATKMITRPPEGREASEAVEVDMALVSVISVKR